MLEWDSNFRPLHDFLVAKKKEQVSKRKQTRKIMQELNRDVYFKTPYDENSTSNLPRYDETSNRINNAADDDAELDEIIREINFPQDGYKPIHADGMDIHANNLILRDYMLEVTAKSLRRRGLAYKKALE